MKRFTGTTFILNLFLISCSEPNTPSSVNEPERDFTALHQESAALAIIGNWKSDENDFLYFGPVREDSPGSFILIQGSRPERPFRHKYTVEKDSPTKVEIRIEFESGGEEVRHYSPLNEGKRLKATWFPEYLDEPVSVVYKWNSNSVTPKIVGGRG